VRAATAAGLAFAAGTSFSVHGRVGEVKELTGFVQLPLAVRDIPLFGQLDEDPVAIRFVLSADERNEAAAVDHLAGWQRSPPTRRRW
jgi:hypothetical protein